MTSPLFVIASSLTPADWLIYALSYALSDFFVGIIVLASTFLLALFLIGWGLSKLWNRSWNVLGSFSSLIINGGLALLLATSCLVLHGLSGNNFGSTSDSGSIYNRLSRLEKAISTDEDEAETIGKAIANLLTGEGDSTPNNNLDDDPILDSGTTNYIANLCKDKTKNITNESIASMLSSLCKSYRQTYYITLACLITSLIALLLSVSYMSYSSIRVVKPSIN